MLQKRHWPVELKPNLSKLGSSVITGSHPAPTEFIHHYSSMAPTHLNPTANRDIARNDGALNARAESAGASLG
jgi:hypothetical protein